MLPRPSTDQSQAPTRASILASRLVGSRRPVQAEHVFRLRDRITYVLLLACWIASILYFWPWMVRADHVVTPWFFIIFASAYAYETTFLPSMYLFYVGCMRRPVHMDPESGLRVAMITLCVPKLETLDVILEQIEALAAVRYPHDSWILDEGNDPAIRIAAERLGVKYFTRKGLPEYNQPFPPFKARTKAGNVNTWLDAHGAEYDYFVQLDIDHRPEPDYLNRVLGYFQDSRVAWVQGPSLYGNLENWIARGAAEQELVLQGPLQRGFYGTSKTPFIIGSHCTYRMSAVREIGGFQPTRAEDHLDTVMLASRGYQGVFVDEPLAIGGGPDTFDTYLRQQFAWAYSMLEIMLHHTPRLIRKYRPIQAVQFLFAQTWYLCWSLSMLALFVTPVLVLFSEIRPMSAPLPVFLLRAAPLSCTSFAIWWWTRAWQLPRGLNLSWRGVVLHIARWPIVCWALLNVVLRVKHPYMVTPKGDRGLLPPFSLRSQAIYLTLAWLSAFSVWFHVAVGGQIEIQGYIIFVLLGLGLMTTVVAVNVATDLTEIWHRGISLMRGMALRALPLSLLVATAAAGVVTSVVSIDRITQAATWAGDRQTIATSAGQGRQVLLDAARDAAPMPTIDPATPVPSTATREIPEAASATVIPDSADMGSDSVWSRLEPGQETRSYIPALPLPTERVGLGAYDPGLAFQDLSLDIEHWYVGQSEPQLMAGAITRTRGRRTLLLTIEPFGPRNSRDPVLDYIVDGRNDDELRALARLARDASPQTILVRWGHEMELSGLYPWAANRPDLYRGAFRRVVETFRAEGASNVRWVWSPAGNAGLESYYPGDDVVDYVGLTVLEDEGWDEGFGLPRQSFTQLLRPRYERVVGMNKPVIVAEFGVSGDLSRKTAWLGAAAASLTDFPAVQAMVYFNDVNAPTTLSTQPDWRIPSDVFGQFLAPIESDVKWVLER